MKAQGYTGNMNYILNYNYLYLFKIKSLMKFDMFYRFFHKLFSF
jgi:hypothetical protein